MLALNAGKNVLCEKAFTVNAAQTKILIDTAQKKNLFLMEAVWTRYFPLSVQIRECIKAGEIGEVLRTVADTSFSDDVEVRWGTEHRMVNPDLAGGALLDCKCNTSHYTTLPYRLQTMGNLLCIYISSYIRLTNSASSGHLLPNLGLPNPLPHPPQRTTQTTNRPLPNHTIPPNRRRRSYNNPTKLPNQHAHQQSPPAPIARRRNDQYPRRR